MDYITLHGCRTEDEQIAAEARKTKHIHLRLKQNTNKKDKEFSHFFRYIIAFIARCLRRGLAHVKLNAK